MFISGYLVLLHTFKIYPSHLYKNITYHIPNLIIILCS